MDTAITTMRDANALNAGYADADLALHLALADACGNVFMRSIGAVIEAALRVSFQLSSPPDPVEHERSWKAHADIVEAIRRGDADAAARATEIGRGSCRERVGKYV